MRKVKMTNRIFYFFLIVSVISACNKKVERTDGFITSQIGTPYKVIQSNSGSEKPRRGDVVKMSQRVLDKQGNDFGVAETIYHILDRKGDFARKIDDILVQSHLGDSLIIELPRSLLVDTKHMPGSERNQPTDAHFSINKILPYAEYEQIIAKKSKQERKVRAKKNDKQIQEYLTRNAIQAKKKETGVYVWIEKLGTGKLPEIGDDISMHYEVINIGDNSVVDNSREREKPFNFIIGRRAVIVGLEKTVQLLPVGTKATIIIPSDLAYGEEKKGEQLPANSNLRFDLEVLGVE
jgi:FKBP-type peptidyl-prolyl cis-trans isomerase